jgi:hypothetical protein
MHSHLDMFCFGKKNFCTGPYYKTHELNVVYMCVQLCVCACVCVCVRVCVCVCVRERERERGGKE